MTASILYLHGLNSSPLSKKATQLKQRFEQAGKSDRLLVPALHHHPAHAIRQAERAIEQLGTPLLVGSSLGGYYATHLAERFGLPAVLINPAVNPHLLFDGFLGPQTNLYTGEQWQLTLDHIHALAALSVLPSAPLARYQVWLQTGDETLDYRRAEAFYDGATLDIQSGGDHSYQGFEQRIPELLALAGFNPAEFA